MAVEFEWTTLLPTVLMRQRPANTWAIVGSVTTYSRDRDRDRDYHRDRDRDHRRDRDRERDPYGRDSRDWRERRSPAP
ncbi:hypothetical protein MPER_13612, partial [Moniliophthora perniciosa FA553]